MDADQKLKQMTTENGGAQSRPGERPHGPVFLCASLAKTFGLLLLDPRSSALIRGKLF
jgi:hypothetical protein